MAWFEFDFKVKIEAKTERAVMIAVTKLPQYHGYCYWIPKGCIKKGKLLLHSDIDITLFVPTKAGGYIEDNKEKVSAEEFYNLYYEDK